MSEQNTFLTRKGYEKLKKELEHLKGVGRREMADKIGTARELGDLKENAEYDAAKDAQAMMERRINDLNGILSRVTILDDEDLPTDIVCIGAEVTLKDAKTGEKIRYILVSEEEADISQDKISTTSPIGQGLLRHKKGDTVKIQVPVGTLEYKILEIKRG